MNPQLRKIKCDEVVKYIKQDLNRIEHFSPFQNKILKSEYCKILILDIKSNLMKLYTFDEIEYVRETLGKNNWQNVLYYLDKFKTHYEPESFSID